MNNEMTKTQEFAEVSHILYILNLKD